ncbi:MAG: hypothetical protein SGI73_09415 [Chloroflexota bacterium]|nr:hypothetical protein [Chloroflexota bacterium]
MMQIESFLFTRNQRQDFTAFVRPAAISNRDVSTIANALNAINDVERLTRAFPSLYGFALSETVLFFRHYDSGRRHAGRPISVVEGIGARMTWARHFARALPYLLAHQDDVLNIADGVGDIETLTPTPSPVREMPDRSAAIDVDDTAYIEDFLVRRQAERLHVPFDRGGLILLAGALAEPRFASPLAFAFGTNGDVIAAFAARGIDFDIIGTFNAEQACFRSRETGQKTGAVNLPVIDESLDDTRPNAPIRIEDTSGVMSMRAQPPRVQASPAFYTPPQIEPIELPPSGGAAFVPESERMLTMREARRQSQASSQADVPVEPHSTFDPFAVLRRIVRLLTGKRD